MASEIEVKVGVAVDQKAKESARQELKSLAEYFAAAWQDVEKVLKTTAGDTVEDLMKDWNKSISDGWKKNGEVAKGAIKDSVSAVFDGEMDKVEKIWDTAWDKMGATLEATFKDLLAGLANNALNFLGNIFDDLVIQPATCPWPPRRAGWLPAPAGLA